MLKKIKKAYLEILSKSEKIDTKEGVIYNLNLSLECIDEFINNNSSHYYSNITTNFKKHKCLDIYPYENGDFGELEIIKNLLDFSDFNFNDYSINK